MTRCCTKTLLAMSLLSFMAISAQAELPRESVVKEVSELYGITAQQALKRLQAEEQAAELYREVEARQIPGYAGAWFDGEMMSLRVALASDPSTEGFSLVERLGGSPMSVAHSMADLRAVKERLLNQLGRDIGAVTIDPRMNKVELSVRGGEKASVDAAVRALSINPSAVFIHENYHEIQFSSGYVVGGNGTRNPSWSNSPCSIGVPTDGGFFWAGHCGDTYQNINDASGNSLGTVVASSWPYIDMGLVSTGTGWTPVPQINGYTDGTIYVPSKWSGYNEYPIGSTVCRYGQTSGGPHCGTVDAFDQSSGSLSGYTRVYKGCTDDGDSGGPWVAASTDQVQGTNVGGSATNTCPTDVLYTYFHPVKDHVNAYTHTLLSSHGANAPSSADFNCPDLQNSGNGSYSCYSSYNSQGETSMSWSANTGHSSSTTSLLGTCSTGQTVNVTLTLTNSYGSSSTQVSFSCPSGGIQ